MPSFLKTEKNRLGKTPGFTLTEAAIVVGIVGLLLGTIWVAAASVYSRNQVNRAVNALITIAYGVKSLASGSSLNIAADTDITDLLIKMKIPPADFISEAAVSSEEPDTASYLAAIVEKTLSYLLLARPAFAVVAVPTQIISAPWPGSSIKVYSKGNMGDRFDVAFLNLPSKACVQLVVTATGQSAIGAGLMSVGISSTTSDPAVDGGAINALPVSTGVAAEACGTSNTLSAAFRFSVK